MQSIMPWARRNSAPLEALREGLPDGVLDDARPGEADERLGLGDVHVAEEGEARRHAARRGVRSTQMNGRRGVAEALERGRPSSPSA